MRHSLTALEVIKHFEGFKEFAYFDLANVPTIGYGTTEGVTVEDVLSKRRITENEAEKLLKNHVSKNDSEITRLVKVPLEQYQFDAIASWTYNFSPGALRNSTLLKKLNRGDYVGAAEEFLRWNKFLNPKTGVREEAPGLTRRRKTERLLFKGEGLRFWHS